MADGRVNGRTVTPVPWLGLGCRSQLMTTQASAKVDTSNILIACPTRRIKAGEPLIALLPARRARAIHQ
jgi:hypothetical protein